MEAGKRKACYFVVNRPQVRVDFAEQDGDPATTMLREAQAGAYWAVRAHFTARSEPALVVMPTGSGKTAVMTLLAFGLVRDRLLIIAPNRFIVRQIAEEFESFKVARKVGSLAGDIKAPRVHIVEHQLGSEEAWSELGGFDVVVATPNCASPGFSGVCPPPQEPFLFDTIFFDEVHHLPAPTWEGLRETFSNMRIVGFTATPYRKDKQPIPGDIVYSYPISRAMERGIYRKIEFVPVTGHGDEEEKDRRLANRAKELWQHENETREKNGEQSSAKLLVRAARLSETEAIKELYDALDVKLEIVSSERSLSQNLDAIEKVEQNLCDGLLAVGMLGEGFDLPALQIGVLHRPYQSFPITLQFIGRLCRMSGQQSRTAKLLAIPDDIEEHTKGLYDWHADWTELIPNLADAAMTREQARRRFVKDEWRIPDHATEVSLHTLKPSFSVAVYRIVDEEGEKLDIDIARKPELGDKTALMPSTFSKDGQRRILITRTISNPIWTTSTSLLNVEYDLHIYYLTNNLLFEHTTSPAIALRMRKGFVSGPSADTALPIPRVDATRVEQVISQRELLAYFNVGMRRATMASTGVPTYKTLAGSRVEDCIQERDSHFFSVGHLFARVDWDGTPLAVGVSGESAKIWAAARNHLQEFTEWCDRLADTLQNDQFTSLSHLSHLKKGRWVRDMPAAPYAAEPHHRFYDHLGKGLRIECKRQGEGFLPVENQSQYELDVHGDNNATYLILAVGDVNLRVRYDLKAGKVYAYEPELSYESCIVKVPEGGRMRDYDLDDYLHEFPPTLFLVDGGALVGRYYYEYIVPDYNLPRPLFRTENWAALDCEITVEDLDMVPNEERRKALAAAGKRCVLQATAEILKERFSNKPEAFVFCDHRSGEIADYVAFELEQDELLRNRLRIHLFHCKASGEKDPGARQADAYEVLAQARKCVRWLHRSDLFDIVRGRLVAIREAGLNEKRFILGSDEGMEKLVEGRRPGVSSFTVHVVQPGFKITRIQDWHDPSLRVMFLSLYDELRGLGIDFRVIGS
jgi:superfamily II DNA or RNA helicase